MLIYEAQNIQNGKRYFGLTTLSLKLRMNKHKKNAFCPSSKNKKNYFTLAIRKYGWDNFKWRIVGYTDSIEELKEAEKECIWLYNTNNNLYGYNLTIGGEGSKGYKHTNEAKIKIGKSSKGNKYCLGHKIPDDVKEKIRLSCIGKNKGKRYNIGRKHTEESKRKMSEKAKGRIFTEEHKRNISVGGKNRKLVSNETREKLRLAALKQWHRLKSEV